MKLDLFLQMMVDEGASDLFISTGVTPCMKVHGQVERLGSEVLSSEQARQLVYSVMNGAQQREFETTRECNFALFNSTLGRFRVNVFQHQNNLGMVLRRIETRIPDFAELNLPPLLEQLSMEKRGLVLIVGAPGAGKSSTLAAMLGHRNRTGSGHIVCVEDPIEFVHQPAGCIITQREVGIDTDSYESALKNTLRQAPDVIMVGEIRSREALEHAIAFAETGHLCLSTLHATNAAQALDRIVHLFPRDRRDHLLLDMSINLKAIVAQRLVPRADGSGRRAALEVLLNTPLAADLIHRGDTHLLRDLMKRSAEQGMRTFDHAVYELYCQGAISYDDALLYADSTNEVRLMIKLGKGGDPRTLAVGVEQAVLARKAASGEPSHPEPRSRR